MNVISICLSKKLSCFTDYLQLIIMDDYMQHDPFYGKYRYFSFPTIVVVVFC